MTRRLWVFMATMVLANVAGHMCRPLLPLYLQDLGAGVGQVGIFFTLGSIAPLLFQIFGGWMSDSIGRLQAIAIGSVTGAMGYLVYVFAPSWQWLLIATVTESVARSFVAPSYQAFIAEESSEEARGRVYAISQTIFVVVGVVGPPIGGYISQYLGFRVLYVVAGVLYAMATVVRLAMARHAQRTDLQPRERPSLASLKSNLAAMGGLLLAGGVITWIFISDGVRDVSFRMAFELLPLYMQNLMNLSNIQIGWLSSISSLVTMAFLTPAGWLSDRKGERLGIVAGFALISASIALFLNVSPGPGAFWGFAGVWALFGLGGALIDPAYSSLISKVVPVNLRGTAFGLFSTSLGLISLPAPYIGAVLWERFSPQTPFYIPMIVTLVMLPVMWVKFRPSRAKAESEMSEER